MSTLLLESNVAVTWMSMLMLSVSPSLLGSLAFALCGCVEFSALDMPPP
jgi:hypothetical protein